MIKSTHTFILLLPLTLTNFLFSCESADEAEVAEAETKIDSEEEIEAEGIIYYRSFESNAGPYDTDYHYEFYEVLPKETYLDSIDFFSEEFNSFYTVYYFQNQDPDFNNLMHQIAEKTMDEDMVYISKSAPEFPQVYMYELLPFEFYENQKVISMCFVEDVFTEGGNHHNYQWWSVNYDQETNSVLKMDDVFVLETSKDSSDLVNLIVENMEGNAWGDFESSLDEMNFSFVEKGIVFNPPVSWSSGMSRSFAAYDECNDLLQEKWQE
ncbi:MAG: hypothetical protein MI810_14325 [Flavobacteriales bacterium]|nr:hypothetical protein [Flavobacteriales bacterium]